MNISIWKSPNRKTGTFSKKYGYFNHGDADITRLSFEMDTTPFPMAPEILLPIGLSETMDAPRALGVG